mgnify:CR=1 FL=1
MTTKTTMTTSIAVKVIGWSAFARFHFLMANRAQMHETSQIDQAIGFSWDGFMYPPTNVGMAPANVATCEQIIARIALPVFCHRTMPITAPTILPHSIDPIVGLPKTSANMVIVQAPATAAII